MFLWFYGFLYNAMYIFMKKKNNPYLQFSRPLSYGEVTEYFFGTAALYIPQKFEYSAMFFV